MHSKSVITRLSLLAWMTALGFCATVWAEPGWGPDLRLTLAPGDSDLSFNFKHSVATLPDGSVHVVWHDNRNGTR